MLHDIYYILPPHFLKAPVVPAADYILAWQIDAGHATSLSTAYHTASLLPATIPFSLFVSRAGMLTPETATGIIAFFFFTNYDKLAGIPRVLLHWHKPDELQAAAQLLDQQAKNQGFPQIQIQAVLTKDIGTMVFPSNSPEHICHTYKSWLHNPVQDITSLYIQTTELEDIVLLHPLLKAEEKLFSHQNAALFNLKQQINHLKGQVQKLERLYTAASQEISNQATHINILRSQSQTAALQNYYNNEYEILPLWYKQAGHIIKVLMGKRSFKSLFKNSVKKYKS